MKGQSDDIQESAVLEGYSCKDEGCNGFLLRSSGLWLAVISHLLQSNGQLVGQSYYFSFAIWNADDKGFICQQCGRVGDKEEIRKIASEVKSMSEKAFMSLSSGSILLDCSCWEFIGGNLTAWFYVLLIYNILSTGTI